MEKSRIDLLEVALQVQELLDTRRMECRFDDDESFVTIKSAKGIDVTELTSITDPYKCIIWGQENELYVRIYAPINVND